MFRQISTVALAVMAVVGSTKQKTGLDSKPSSVPAVNAVTAEPPARPAKTSGKDCVADFLPPLPPVFSAENTHEPARSGEELAQQGAGVDKKYSRNKSDARSDAERLVEALANQNPKPKLVDSKGLDRFFLDGVVPLFDKKYDWKEQDRVRAATEAVATNKSPEVWKSLVAHEDDRRYWLTLADEAGAAEFGAAENYCVGDYCTELAYRQLMAPVIRNQYIVLRGPIVDTKPHERAILSEPFRNGLREWCKSHPGKTFYELQIEICKRAIDDLPGLTGPTAQDKVKFREQMEFEIEQLRKTKTGLFGGDGYTRAFSGERYNRFDAKRTMEIRKAYEKAKRPGETKDEPEIEQTGKATK
ncbi:MAG: hypothetical protein ACLP9L_20290 [Thermoguttaceae bacterium]